MRGAFASFIGLLAIGAHAAAAQQIRGLVRDSASRDPIAGAVVSALSARDSTLARTITDRRGVFHLAATGAQTAAVRVAHIGYRPVTVFVGVQDSLGVALVHLPSVLEAVRTVAREDCPRRDDAAQAASLWDQARTALLAGVVAREANPAAMRLVRFRRMMEGVGPDSIAGQTVQTIEGRGTRVFASAQPASYFEEHGYLAGEPGAYRLYFPDDEVLLDESFARTHCFRLERDARGHAGAIGIAFEPTKTRDTLTDIAGTLWVDSARASLRSMQFTYVPVHLGVGRSGTARGSLTFETAANGIPMMIAWSGWQPVDVTAAIATRTVSPNGTAQIWRTTKLATAVGGELASAAWDDGTTWLGTLPGFAGVALDPATRKRRGGVPITLLNAARTVRTDSLGRFNFSDLPPGPYFLAVADTLFAVFRDVVGVREGKMLGFHPARSFADEVTGQNRSQDADGLLAKIRIDRGSNPDVTIELPYIDEGFRRTCAKRAPGDTLAVLAVWVLAGAEPAGEARVTATWQDAGKESESTVSTDGSGRAILCGVPRGRSVMLSTTWGKEGPVATEVSVSAGRFVALAVVRLAAPGGSR